MSDYMTTTTSSFPVKDISHKPKRMQGDMIRLKEVQSGEAPEVSSNEQETLSVITLERAISYYKRLSSDAVNGKLYSATASWLEELLVTRSPKTKAEMKAEEVVSDESADIGQTSI